MFTNNARIGKIVPRKCKRGKGRRLSHRPSTLDLKLVAGGLRPGSITGRVGSHSLIGTLCACLGRPAFLRLAGFVDGGSSAGCVIGHVMLAGMFDRGTGSGCCFGTGCAKCVAALPLSEHWSCERERIGGCCDQEFHGVSVLGCDPLTH